VIKDVFEETQHLYKWQDQSSCIFLEKKIIIVWLV